MAEGIAVFLGIGWVMGFMSFGFSNDDAGRIQEEEAMIQLPQWKRTGAMSVEETMAKRRSVRHYLDQPIRLEDLSQLLWSAQGISGDSDYRTGPSAGALYPLEVYVVAGSIEGLPSGIYHYQPCHHQFQKIASGDFRKRISEAAYGQMWMTPAPVILAVTTVYERTTSRYGGRGERYVHMEVGHVGQNISLQAIALGYSTCIVGAFSDSQVQELLKLDRSEKPLYLIPIGKEVP